MKQKFSTIDSYNESQSGNYKEICNSLYKIINENLPDSESKIWHGHPVWFINENPIVGYSKLKDSIRLMFWSGADFNENKLKLGTGKFKDASIYFTSIDQVDSLEIKKWLNKSKIIQWDYKNVQKRKGKLVKLDI